MPTADDTTVRYTVRFPHPATHYAEVEANFPAAGRDSVDLFMPVWTPGSYLVREYARHVEDARAYSESGEALKLVKSAKNRWRVATNGSGRIRFLYRLYCREMSVRTNWVEDSFALLNGAPTFVTLAGTTQRTHEVLLELPDTWKTSVSGMQGIPDTPNGYTAPDLDTLVDSPILAGNPALYGFEAGGVAHLIVNQGEDGVWDAARAAADVERIVRWWADFWGGLPYSRYVFLNMITESGGGLEHANSTCLMTSRWATRTRRAYLGWIELVCHEFLHVWNVKRLRPRELGPFDYEAENYTRSLWVAEGLTEYYTPLALHRAGLSSLEEYLGIGEPGKAGSGLSGEIATLQTTPGRHVASVSDASFNAWIKAYRPDENSGNTTISYYTKGAVIGWLLDSRIRRATEDTKSLDDVMRLAYERYCGEAGFTSSEFQQTAEEVAGVPLRDFFPTAVESTAELDYSEALDWWGLQFRKPASVSGTDGKAWLGAEFKADGGRLVVSKVPRNTPGYGVLNVEDELIAIGDFRVRADQLSHRLEQYRPGEELPLLIARRDRLLRLDVTLAHEPERQWQLEIRTDATPEQKRHLATWLHR